MLAKIGRKGSFDLCLQDMAGVLRPEAATLLISALRERHPSVPIHVHTHDTSGAGVAAMIAAAKAGADAVDAAVDAMSGLTSQPSLGALVASLARTEQDTGLDLARVSEYSSYWEQTRQLYASFECTATMRSGNADVYQHEIPGGQYTNLQFQAFSLGLGDKFEEIKHMYREANLALGDIIKVTPSSKTVGDLAQFMVQNNLTRESVVERAEELSFPNSVIEFFQGQIGQPPYGFPEPLRSRVLRDRESVKGRPGADLPPVDFPKLKAELEEKHGRELRDEDAVSAALYPRVFDDFETFRQEYGPVDKIPTRQFLVGLEHAESVEIEIERGKELSVQMMAEGDLNDRGFREVFFELNGQTRTLYIRDTEASKGISEHPKALAGVKGQVGAPMPGEVLEIQVKEGERVEAQASLGVLSAMKMEMGLEAPCAGVVKRILISPKTKVAAGDLLFEIET